MAENTRNREFTCCICGKKVIGWGNDPWPIDTNDDVECCDECDLNKVIPARLEQLAKNTQKS